MGEKNVHTIRRHVDNKLENMFSHNQNTPRQYMRNMFSHNQNTPRQYMRESVLTQSEHT